ncbi:MAG: YsnF/AvaK domain-containing protein [Actinobacteria bacterium]|nr:YsnF/AvaK domain-containing protein [Actinomycetota bacterium]
MSERGDPPQSETAAELDRHEEELRIGKEEHELGTIRARKRVDTEKVEEIVPRQTEYADIERETPAGEDSGEIETLPDGSVSVPVFEEQLVVTKRLVVRERVIVRKHTVTEDERVEAELRKERVEIDAKGDVELDDSTAA